VGDARTEPLLNIINLIPDVEGLKFVLVENVRGFETSEARNRLTSTLSRADFSFREFLLTPTQVMRQCSQEQTFCQFRAFISRLASQTLDSAIT
jgi:tRNA (cytosine38-C5)-methyltransferase